jgi:hypothetical protein
MPQYASVKEAPQSQWIFETIKWYFKIVQFWLSSWQLFFYCPIFRNYFWKLQNRHGENSSIIGEVIVCVQFELTTNLNEAQSRSVIDGGREVQVKDPHTSINTRIFYSATLYEVYICIVPNSPSTVLEFQLCLNTNLLYRHLNLKQHPHKLLKLFSVFCSNTIFYVFNISIYHMNFCLRNIVQFLINLLAL